MTDSGFRLLTDLGLIPKYLEAIDDESESSALVMAIGKQIALVRNFLTDGIPTKIPKIAWFRRTPDGMWSTVLKHRRHLMFDGNAYQSDDLGSLEQAYLLIRTHAATHAFEEYLRHLVSRVDAEKPAADSAKAPLLRSMPAARAVDRRLHVDDLEPQPDDDITIPVNPADLIDDGPTDEYYEWIKEFDQPGADPLLADWPSGRRSIPNAIIDRLPHYVRLVEPFGGAGSLSQILARRDQNPYLGYDDETRSYLCADVDADIVNMLTHLSTTDDFEQHAKKYFDASRKRCKEKFEFLHDGILKEKGFVAPYEYEDAQIAALEEIFAANRDKLEPEGPGGKPDESLMHAVRLLWLQRCAKGSFLPPDPDRMMKVEPWSISSFPEAEFSRFRKFCEQISYVCADFRDVMNVTSDNRLLKEGDVIYCHPPFANHKGDEVPVAGSRIPRFKKGFAKTAQRELAALAQKCARNGFPVLISNQDNEFTRNLYTEHGVTEIVGDIPVWRSYTKELLAIWTPDRPSVAVGSVDAP